MKRGGGDDGARTRDLRRDRFVFRANQIMELPVLSAASERQGPTWNAIKCPKTIHLLHAYYTHILIPEYLNRLIFDTSNSYMNFHGITPFDAGDPGRPALVNLQAENSGPVNLHLEALMETCKEPKACRIRRSVAHLKRRGAFDGIGHTSACLKPRQYCAAIRGFPQIRPGVPTLGIIPKAVA